MIKEFKKKTMLILTIIFWLILLGILVTVNVSNIQSNMSQTKRLLSRQSNIVDKHNAKKKTKAPIVDGEELSRIYSVKMDEEGNYTVVFSPNESSDEDKKLIQIAEQIVATGKLDGMFGRYRYCTEIEDEERLISFLDYGIWQHQQYRMLIISLILGAVGMILLLGVAVKLTSWLIRPVVESFEKQKQFISDAGHELKTPITVVKASLDMLENEVGSNKYLDYIRTENSRMSELAYDLLYLTNLEKQNQKASMVSMDLSRCIEGACLPFESIVFELGYELKLSIEKNIKIQGDESQIRKMIEVFVDNATKHTFPHGTIAITLSKEKGKAVLKVSNEGEAIPEKEQEKIFDRFYRGDKARDRKEGRYGLGLSVASAIAAAHKSKIQVICKDNWTTFQIAFHSEKEL